MLRTIVLDTSPLSTVTRRRGVADGDACRRWVVNCRDRGHRVLAPAIAYYEVARELVRAGNAAGRARLDAFCAIPDTYLPLTDSALRLGALLWAQARNAGTPTADPKELDCDVLIAAQAFDLGLLRSELVVATGNIGHLARFVNADLWWNISP
jgi:predicted nucleic acid-binding protein